jgi:ubiquinone/menaquinone biosynthesis C-methylase UbiE
LTGFYDPIAAFTVRERTLKTALLRQVALRPGDRVLDVGCGTGTLLLMASARQPDARLFGIDADERMLKVAVRKAARAGRDIELRRGLADRLPYDGQSFDAVLSSLFFHHLRTEQKVRALDEIYRVLRPGGKLHVADFGPASGAVMRFLFLAVRLADGFEPTEDTARGRLPSLIERSGFREVVAGPTFSTVFGTLAIHSAVRAGDVARGSSRGGST